MATPEMKRIGSSNVYKVYVHIDNDLDKLISHISDSGGKITSIAFAPLDWQGDKGVREMGNLVYIVM